jgi:hypothetical protein
MAQAKKAAVAQEEMKQAPVVEASELTNDGPADANDAAMFDGDAEEGFTVDLSDTDENASGFVAIPRGMYPAIIDDCTYGLSQRSGNPMWTIVWEIESGEFAGRKLFFHLPFTPNMKPRVKKFLARVAPELANVPFNPKSVAEEGLLIGKRGKLRVDVRKYEGENRNNVRDVLPPEAEAAGDGFLS